MSRPVLVALLDVRLPFNVPACVLVQVRQAGGSGHEPGAQIAEQREAELPSDGLKCHDTFERCRQVARRITPGRLRLAVGITSA